jgi:hypothetical protein
LECRMAQLLEITLILTFSWSTGRRNRKLSEQLRVDMFPLRNAPFEGAIIVAVNRANRMAPEVGAVDTPHVI